MPKMNTRYHQRVPSNADSIASDTSWDARSIKQGFHLTHRQFICWGTIIGTIIISGVISLLTWAIISRVQSGE
jgi:hypothetical protein